MGWVLFIILATILLIVSLMFRYALKIKVHFDSDKPEINLKLVWLDPLVNAYVTIENALPVLKIHLFRHQVFNRPLNRGKKKRGGAELVKISEPTEIRVEVHYGFRDPYATGIACGMINMATELVNIESIRQTPDFLSSSDFIYLNADAKVNLGSTLVRLLKSGRSR